MSQATSTIDHDTIRTWAEERNGHPARVKDSGEGGILRIVFEPPRGLAGKGRELGRNSFRSSRSAGLRFSIRRKRTKAPSAGSTELNRPPRGGWVMALRAPVREGG